MHPCLFGGRAGGRPARQNGRPARWQLPDALVIAAAGAQAGTRRAPAHFSADGHRRTGGVPHMPDFLVSRPAARRRAIRDATLRPGRSSLLRTGRRGIRPTRREPDLPAGSAAAAARVDVAGGSEFGSDGAAVVHRGGLDDAGTSAFVSSREPAGGTTRAQPGTTRPGRAGPRGGSGLRFSQAPGHFRT